MKNKVLLAFIFLKRSNSLKGYLLFSVLVFDFPGFVLTQGVFLCNMHTYNVSKLVASQLMVLSTSILSGENSHCPTNSKIRITCIYIGNPVLQTSHVHPVLEGECAKNGCFVMSLMLTLSI